MRSSLPLLLGLALSMVPTVTASAQGVPAADPGGAFLVSGEVVAFNAAVGAGIPTLTVDDPSLGSVEVGLGPIWFLRQHGFAAAVGDQVELLAYPCPTCFIGSVAAWVQNFTQDTYIELRDEEGFPLWRGDGSRRGNGGNGAGPSGGSRPGEGGRGGGHQPGDPGQGPHGHGGGLGFLVPDLSRAATVTGTVLELSLAAGTPPTLTLDAAQGILEIFLMPFRVIVFSGLEIEPGQELTVTYAPVVLGDGSEVLVAISLTDPATGVTLQLRDPETGAPAAGFGSGRCRGDG